VTLDVSIPANSEAKVSVPKAGLEDVRVEESGTLIWRSRSSVGGAAGVKGGSEGVDYVTFDTGSGSYSFKLTGARTLPGKAE
jgi:alpha-L-rhamnosidase